MFAKASRSFLKSSWSARDIFISTEWHKRKWQMQVFVCQVYRAEVQENCWRLTCPSCCPGALDSEDQHHHQQPRFQATICGQGRQMVGTHAPHHPQGKITAWRAGSCQAVICCRIFPAYMLCVSFLKSLVWCPSLTNFLFRPKGRQCKIRLQLNTLILQVLQD